MQSLIVSVYTGIIHISKSVMSFSGILVHVSLIQSQTDLFVALATYLIVLLVLRYWTEITSVLIQSGHKHVGMYEE